MRSRVIPFVAALITVALIVSLAPVGMRAAKRTTIRYVSPTEVSENVLDNIPMSKPPDITIVGEEISLQELVEIMEKWDNVTIYLPTQLPDGMELTTIWFKYGVYPIAVVVYDSHGERNPYQAEFGIQIVPTGPPDLSLLRELCEEYGDKLIQVNGWWVIIHEKVPSSYQTVVDVWIDGVWYAIGARTLTVEEVIAIIQSMRPVEM